MPITVNLSLKQVWPHLCPKCQAALLELASAQGAKEAIKESLLAQIEGKKEK